MIFNPKSYTSIGNINRSLSISLTPSASENLRSPIIEVHKRKHTITLAVVNQYMFAIWPMMPTKPFLSTCVFCSHMFSSFGDLPKVFSCWAPAAPAALKFRLLDQDQTVWRICSRYGGDTELLTKILFKSKSDHLKSKFVNHDQNLNLKPWLLDIKKTSKETLIPCAMHAYWNFRNGCNHLSLSAHQKWEAAGKPSHNTKVDSRSTWCHIHEDIDATLQGTHDFVSSYLGQRDLVDDLRPLCWRWVMPSVPVCSRVNGGKCMETVGNLL